MLLPAEGGSYLIPTLILQLNHYVMCNVHTDTSSHAILAVGIYVSVAHATIIENIVRTY